MSAEPPVQVSVGEAFMQTLPTVVAIILPSAYLLGQSHTRPKERQPPRGILSTTFFISGTLGLFASAAVQSAITLPLASALFGVDGGMSYLTEFARSEADVAVASPALLAQRREIAYGWRNLLFLPCMAFGVAGVVEESIKYAVVKMVRKYYPGTGGSLNARNGFAVAVAAGLGFATAEAAAYIFSAALSGEKGWALVLTVAERVLYGLGAHGMLGAVMGANFVRRDAGGKRFSLKDVLWMPVMFHGVGNLGLFLVSAYEGNVGFVHPRQGAGVVALYAVVVGVLSTLTYTVRRLMATYPVI